MRILKYNFATIVALGTKENPQQRTILSPVEMPWSEANEEIARREAYNGEYTVEDDGKSEPAVLETVAAMWDELDAAYQEGVDSV